MPRPAAVGDAEGGKSPSTKVPKGSIPCYDPGTLQLLGHAPAFTEQQVCLWGGGSGEGGWRPGVLWGPARRDRSLS